MPYNNGTGTVNTGAAIGVGLFALIIGLAAIVFAVVIYWRIFAKAGYSGALGLLMFVPIVNLVMLGILAFAEWPIYKELNYLRQQAARSQQYPPSTPAVLPQQYPSSPQYPQYSQPQHGQPQPGQPPQNPQYPQQ
jgi:hypothetical protein